MKEPLTKQQARVLSAIVKYRDKHGYPPLMRELAKLMGFAFHAGCECHLAALERKGWIKRTRNRANGITVLP